MAQDNTVTITGNATRDPELRFTPSGQAVTSFGVAVNRRWQNRQTQEWEEATSFIDVTCWAQLAENVAESVGRGAREIAAIEHGCHQGVSRETGLQGSRLGGRRVSDSHRIRRKGG